MADWNVTQGLFGDEAGPLRVLLVCNGKPSSEQLAAINDQASLTSFSHISDGRYMGKLADAMRINLADFYELKISEQHLWFAEFVNERAIRERLDVIRLVSDGVVVAAFKMSDCDIDEIVELQRQREEIEIMKAQTRKWIGNIEEAMLRKANRPRRVISNFDEILSEYGCADFFDMVEEPEIEIDRSTMLDYQGHYNKLIALAHEVSKLEMADHKAKTKVLMDSLRLSSLL